jgi:tetratricopeptide (TPR) repeat protein
MLQDYRGALEDLDKAYVLKLNDAIILKTRGNVKKMLKDYQAILEDLDKAHVLNIYDAIILKICADVKKMLKDYQGALEDFDKANVFEPNNAFNSLIMLSFTLNNFISTHMTLSQ